MSKPIQPRNNEILMREDAFIVTKTDRAGNITYANPIFIEFSGYSERELLGQPQNIVRHPDMPRSVFNLLWKTIKEGDEFFGYVKNRSKNGNFYWVFATVTPSFSSRGNTVDDIVGYFSARRKPDRSKLAIIEDLYRDMLAAERHRNRHDAVAAGTEILNKALDTTGKSYHEFILTL